MPSAPSSINLRVTKLRVQTDSATLLDELSWTAQPGELWALLGANGAGKSTLLSLMAGLCPAGLRTEGAILLGNQSIFELPAPTRARHVAYLPQNPEVPESLDVYETVLLGRSPHRTPFAGPSADDHAQVEAALARFELTALQKRRPRTLSGGEQQRVHLARIMAQGASLWLLDEPYAHLDFRHQRAVLQLLAELVRERAITIVTIAHDLLFLPRTATHTLLLHEGRVLAAGPTQNVWNASNAERAFGIEFAAQDAMLWPR